MVGVSKRMKREEKKPWAREASASRAVAVIVLAAVLAVAGAGAVVAVVVLLLPLSSLERDGGDSGGRGRSGRACEEV